MSFATSVIRHDYLGRKRTIGIRWPFLLVEKHRSDSLSAECRRPGRHELYPNYPKGTARLSHFSAIHTSRTSREKVVAQKLFTNVHEPKNRRFSRIRFLLNGTSGKSGGFLNPGGPLPLCKTTIVWRLIMCCRNFAPSEMPSKRRSWQLNALRAARVSAEGGRQSG